jgi:DNA-binding MarR family transcriptional regulator
MAGGTAAMDIDAGAPPDAMSGSAPMFDLIELFFFAYRDFVADADRLLEAYRFGRAHHRVLHFVNRRPGLTIAELLDILKITKQSLNRVLKDLLDQRFVEARAGVADRRQRLLFPAPRGRKLARELARLQSARFERALAGLPAGTRTEAVAFFLAVIDPAERASIEAFVWRDDTAREPDRRA